MRDDFQLFIGIPGEGAYVRFLTSLWPGSNIADHGIDGRFQSGKFWSLDGSDWWSPSEIRDWRLREPSAATANDGEAQP